MVIQAIKSGAIHNVTKEEWQRIVNNGMAHRFKVLDRGESAIVMPEQNQSMLNIEIVEFLGRNKDDRDAIIKDLDNKGIKYNKHWKTEKLKTLLNG